MMNKFTDTLSDYLSRNKAMPVLLGLVLIVLNLLLQFLPAWPAVTFLARSNLFLHLGIILGLIGLLLGDAL